MTDANYPVDFSNLDSITEQLEKISPTADGCGSAFRRVWIGHEPRVTACLRDLTCSRRQRVLTALIGILSQGPTSRVFAVDIAHFDPTSLRELDSLYDAWALLVDCGLQVAARGKEDRDWESHELPITESYRWEVKARLSALSERKVAYFERAHEAAARGQTLHCQNRARHLLAHARRHAAESLVRRKRFKQASELFSEASSLAAGTDLEYLVRFRGSLCQLRDAELRLDLDQARSARLEALQWAGRLPEAAKLFRRPNPWTSLADLKNEELFIDLLAGLREQGLAGLPSAIGNLRKIIGDCEASPRRDDLSERLTFLEGVLAASRGIDTLLDDRAAQLAIQLAHPPLLRSAQDLLDKLTDLRFGADPGRALTEVLNLLPLDAVGSGKPGVPPLMCGVPAWLQSLPVSNTPDRFRTLLLWWVRIIFDYVWSVCEKDAEEEGRELRQRPPFWKCSLGDLANEFRELREFAGWAGTPGEALGELGEMLSQITLQSPTVQENEVEEQIRLVLRSTDMLFPLVVDVRWAGEMQILMERLDGAGDTYRYRPDEVDSRSRSRIPQTGTRVYVKERYRRSLRKPQDRRSRPLYLYPAPVAKKVRRIAETSSPAVLLHALGSDAHPMDLAAELTAIPPGNAEATRYQRLVMRAIEMVFRPSICRPRCEQQLDEGLEKVDIVFRVSSTPTGFFARLSNVWRVFCPLLFIECVNGADQPEPDKFRQLGHYLRPNRTMFGLLVCRKILDRTRLRSRCRTFVSEGKHILVLDDEAMQTLLEYREADETGEISDFMESLLESIVL
ncbi:MAG: hypothetical protein AB1646_24585 [Thermodesulfobacteriota bacterium]